MISVLKEFVQVSGTDRRHCAYRASRIGCGTTSARTADAATGNSPRPSDQRRERQHPLTLLCLSRTYGRIHRPGEVAVELAGDVSLEAAADFPGGLSLGGAPGDVGAGAGAAAHPDQRDGVDGA